MQRIPENANWAVVAERKTVAPWGECSQHLDFGLPASKTVREYASLVLRHRFVAIHYEPQETGLEGFRIGQDWPGSITPQPSVFGWEHLGGTQPSVNIRGGPKMQQQEALGQPSSLRGGSERQASVTVTRTLRDV